MLTQYAGFGLIISRMVDLVRHSLDKHDRIPKAYWLGLSMALGIGAAFLSCGTGFLHNACGNQVLNGLGLGSAGALWHEAQSWLSGAPAPTPKGLLPSPPPAG